MREASDRTRWEMRKNLPPAKEVTGALRPIGGMPVTVEQLPHDWLGWCGLPAPAA